AQRLRPRLDAHACAGVPGRPPEHEDPQGPQVAHDEAAGRVPVRLDRGRLDVPLQARPPGLRKVRLVLPDAEAQARAAPAARARDRPGRLRRPDAGLTKVADPAPSAPLSRGY